MSYGIKLHVWGDYALFSRPEMKVERVSYDVITPSAARGVLEAIYWKPQIRWVIDRIHVLKPVQFTSVRRNELASKASAATAKSAMRSGAGSLGIAIEDDRQQRAALLLRDIGYVIEAHFDLLPATEDGPEAGRVGKHLDMFKRRARAGQCFQQPYFGCREFPVSFVLLENDAPLPVCTLAPADRDKDFGFMLHDILFDQDAKTKAVRSTSPRFFRAVMKNGIIDVPSLQLAHA
ncbi:CRISPR-associated protein Cas5, subtype I-C/DVULG [Opitutaceae bacterium TAV1]|nr:CRISPR-associated protein Cas5, subtype I-C/DVULG [Opitutaceae bacterium TAV1]